MVPVSYIVTAIVSAAFGSVTTIFHVINNSGSKESGRRGRQAVLRVPKR